MSSEQRMYPGTSPDERTTFAPYSAFEIPADLRQLYGRYDVESTARRTGPGTLELTAPGIRQPLPFTCRSNQSTISASTCMIDSSAR